MRIKIIAVNALIVALVGMLAFLLVRASLGSAISNKDQLAQEAQNEVNGAASRLQLDGLRTERWLSAAATEPATLDALAKASPSARADAATKRSEDLVSKMKNDPLFEKNVPTLVAFIDTSTHIVGRNGTTIGRGDSIGSFAGLKATLATGQSGSDVWFESKDRLLASYVVVRDASSGAIVGALIAARPLSDTLSRVSDATTGRALDLVAGEGFELVGSSATRLPQLDTALGASAKDMLKNAMSHQQTDNVRDGEIIVAAAPLPSFADGRRALLVAAAPASLLQDPSSLTLLPIFGAMAIGLMLVIVAGLLLGNYITRPINMLEEGLLAILNGQADKRFELDHAELGGLAFRIDQLLNQLMGVEEDNTDAEGRPSRSPTAATFNDGFAVDDKRGAEGGVDPNAARALAAEAAPEYYARIYREYIAAKRGVGEATDHITEQAFATRIQGMEQEAGQRAGRAVRYQVQSREQKVFLVEVPLP